MLSGAPLHRLLGDPARLRILRLLGQERLNVSEVTGIVALAQSGVSRHLGLLKDAGLVEEQREGGYTYFRLATELAGGGNGAGPLAALLRAEFEAAGRTETGRADDARLEEVRRLRKENFDAHAGPDTNERQLVPGRSWAAWARALGHLLPPLRVADLGCGEGYLTIEASRWAATVIAVDRSKVVLGRARALAKRRRVRNVIWKRGELERLPIRDATVDVVLLSQALHHAEDPPRALREAVRILRPGGRLLVLDLREHAERWVRDRLGDRWLGFRDEALARLLHEAGLSGVRTGVGARRVGDPFTVIVASGRKPASPGVRRGAVRQAGTVPSSNRTPRHSA
ncbi:MAG TPA: metalloregulator ArsR/SmtB family transcription factor [Vicinamibacterales bacterium]|nr:metalloregulator ArsR/SmtB family transcription factor [Vicinamibacterales bacterium]